MALDYPNPAVTNPWVDPNEQEWFHDGDGWVRVPEDPAYIPDPGLGNYTVIAKNASFSPVKSDAPYAPLYIISGHGAVDVVIHMSTASVAGFKTGDVISFMSIDQAATGLILIPDDGGASVRVPLDKLGQLRGYQAIVSAVYTSGTVVALYGDLESA